jgi:hypothetical protein
MNTSCMSAVRVCSAGSWDNDRKAMLAKGGGVDRHLALPPLEGGKVWHQAQSSARTAAFAPACRGTKSAPPVAADAVAAPLRRRPPALLRPALPAALAAAERKPPAPLPAPALPPPPPASPLLVSASASATAASSRSSSGGRSPAVGPSTTSCRSAKPCPASPPPATSIT